jgi:hypothetical protein
MIRVDHSACLALGGNFDPCYILTINAVPSLMGPTTNKRNASLVQSFLADILSVPAERGIVTFKPIPEENLAMSGNTMQGEAERQEKLNGVHDPNGIKSAIKDATRRSMTFPKSNPKLNGDYKSNGNLTATSTSSPSITPPPPSTSIKDQPSSSTDKDGRPSTAHGGLNGLRMNGVSTEQLTGPSARLPNGRPRTFGGSSTPASVQDSMKQEPLPHVSRQTAQQPQRSSMQRASVPKRSSMVNGSGKTQQTQSNGTVARAVQIPRTNTAPNLKSSKHTPIVATEQRPKNTYLDNVSSLTKKTPATVAKADEDDDDDIPLAKTAAGKANVAKRRSTFTATPEIPPSRKAASKAPLKPPPVPEDTKSMSSRLSKRKSLLRMFRRESTPAWYK